MATEKVHQHKNESEIPLKTASALVDASRDKPDRRSLSVLSLRLPLKGAYAGWSNRERVLLTIFKTTFKTRLFSIKLKKGALFVLYPRDTKSRWCPMISNQESFTLSHFMAIYDIVVPKDNMLRQIGELVDFTFILEEN